MKTKNLNSSLEQQVVLLAAYSFVRHRAYFAMYDIFSKNTIIKKVFTTRSHLLP